MNHVDCVDDSGHDNDNGNCCDFDGNYDNDYDAWEGVSHKDDNDDDDDTHQCDALHILYHMILTIHIYDEDYNINNNNYRCVGRRCT